MPSPPTRRATQPQRRFTPQDLAQLDRDERRKLTQVLLAETGSRIVEVDRPIAYGASTFSADSGPSSRPSASATWPPSTG